LSIAAQEWRPPELPPDEGSAPSGNPYPPDLAGRRAAVTGAAKGIGLAIALELITAGAEVTAIDNDDGRLLDAYAGLRCTIIVEDIRRADKLADRVLAGGPVDLVVNNVGVSRALRHDQITQQDYDEVFDTNLRGPLFFTQRLLDAFKRARDNEIEQGKVPRRGAILFVSSVHARASYDPLYSMTKAAIERLVCELAAEYRRHGMRVNALSPGWIRTSSESHNAKQQVKLARMREAITMGEPGSPVDAAHIALVALSDTLGRYMNGANIDIDGGLLHHTSYQIVDGQL
jgi:NAD(P)-dependent dehydrogenase (short-subunit alcohol dehydrogenase family)